MTGNLQATYPQGLIDSAKEKGYKAANLEFLDKILLEFNKEAGEGIAIEVPKHISISNQAVVEHLNKYAPLWQEKWQSFCAFQGSLSDNLKPAAIEALKEIQKLIHEAFNNHELKIENLSQGEHWMVRSTGDEDRVDVANPGGNESVPSDNDSINESIGTVVASYFSEKSMSQRLKSGEAITAKPPLMPCLIQKLVGETPSVNLPPVSGVIYTDSGNIRIQAAYGHGELVVNSKGNVDNIFVSKEDVVHEYVGDKKFRLVPSLNLEAKKMTLEEAQNNEFAQLPALNEETSMRLAKFASFVENKYGMRMDIEFVFDPNSNVINIVQSRPIPEGKRQCIAPSALSNDFISLSKPAHIEGQVITPDVMSAKVITKREEVLVCNGIDEALSSFLKNNNNEIKAVIINKSAPDTSHEAGFFSSQAIPVIYADQYDLAEEWVKELDTHALIIDPQHAAIYQVTKEQMKDDLIVEGVFRSTLSPLVTPIVRDFVQGPSNEFLQTESATIGELIIEAKSNPDATQKLFRFFAEKGSDNKIDYSAQEISQKLKELLSLPVLPNDFSSHKETLANIINFIGNIKNEKGISEPTYQQLVISGVELYKALEDTQLRPQDHDKKLNYLNIYQKFNGLMAAEGKQGILSTSVFKELSAHQERELLKQEAIEAGLNLSTINEDVFLRVAANQKYLINEKDHTKWLSFCYDACKDKENAKALQQLVSDISKLSLQDYWMNVNFLAAFNSDKNIALPNLKMEYEKNLAASEDILKAAKIIDKMEHQIGQWSSPQKFDKLFAEFKQNIEEASRFLSLNHENKLTANLAAKQLYRLVDAIDLSIKQVQNSRVYEDKEQQVKNFKVMVGEFLNLLDQKVDTHKDRVQQMQSLLNNINSNRAEELLPSKDFSVIKADFFQDSYNGFEYGFKFIDNKTLADLYTL